MLAFLPYVRRHGPLDVLEILPSWYPVVALSTIAAFFEYGEGLVEVLAIDVVENLPQHLAILELVPRAHSIWEVEGVDLSQFCQHLRGLKEPFIVYPVEQSSKQLWLEVIHGE